MDYNAIIDKYYPEDNELRRILTVHSRRVADKALAIVDAHPELDADRQFVEEAAMLHDIGIFLTDADGIHCHGTHPYICHGTLGAELMRREGYPRHALVCERHTGAGLSAEDIQRQNLPISPVRDLLPVSIEEQIICFADKFFSKTRPEQEKSVERALASIAKFGETSAKRFENWMNKFLIICLLFSCSLSATAQDNIQALADSIEKYQMPNGGWPKNQNWAQGADQKEMQRCRETGFGTTIDNGATTSEIAILARADRCTPVIRGIRFLLKMQYPNGGFPQFYPCRNTTDYYNRITFNDNAMVSVMKLLRSVFSDEQPYSNLPIPASLKDSCRQSYNRGIECILACQIRDRQGNPTVWCQQHDEHTLAPASARKYELASYCASGETPNIIHLLLDEWEKTHSEAIAAAVKGAVTWLEAHAIHNKYLRTFTNSEGKRDKELVDSIGAPTLWARFYDLDKSLPLFSDRHGLPLSDFNQIGYERRNGYSWLGTNPQQAIDRARQTGILNSQRKD